MTDKNLNSKENNEDNSRITVIVIVNNKEDIEIKRE